MTQEEYKKRIRKAYIQIGGALAFAVAAFTVPEIYLRSKGLEPAEKDFKLLPNGEVLLYGEGRVNFSSRTMLTSAGGQYHVPASVPKMFNIASFDSFPSGKQKWLKKVQVRACDLAANRPGYASVCGELKPHPVIVSVNGQVQIKAP